MANKNKYLKNNKFKSNKEKFYDKAEIYMPKIFI